LFQLALTFVIFALVGFAVGIRPRPRRQLQAKRAFIFLSQPTVIVLLAMSILLNPSSPAQFKAWGVDELDLIGVYIVLALIALVGGLLVTPMWGFVVGRFVTRRGR
jgi:hypothetical protein